MNMLAFFLLLLPVVLAFMLIYGPAVHASLNPGNEIMTASNYTFQSDTFSAAGAIGSLAGNSSDPMIITGRWNLDVQAGAVADFLANLTMVNASSTGYRIIQLSNLSLSEVAMQENGTAVVTGMLDITINDTETLKGVNVTISLTKFRSFNMTLSEPSYLAEPIYGTVDQPQETTASSNGLVTEGSSIFGNVTEKFRLPQLPSPFR
jgi:hypothetical protein